MYDMPSARVFDAMITPEPERMLKLFSLFRLAIMDQSRVEDLTMLTFDELMEVVGLWMGASNEKQAQRAFMREHGITESDYYDE